MGLGEIRVRTTRGKETAVGLSSAIDRISRVFLISESDPQGFFTTFDELLNIRTELARSPPNRGTSREHYMGEVNERKREDDRKTAYTDG